MLIYLVILLFLTIILFIYFDKETFTTDNSYKSITHLTSTHEIYSEKDKFYPSYKICLTKRNQLKKLLKYGDDFFKKNNINYSIFYGTLLGYIRNKKIIPYDHDVDCIVGKESIKKLLKLGYNKDIKNVIFNDEIAKYKPNFNSTQIYLILNYSLLHNNGYGKRYSCNGEESKNQQDACSYNGLFGRFILHSTYYDIFPYNKRTAQLKKHVEYTEQISDMSVINDNEIIRSKFENMNISLIKKPKVTNILKFLYGKNYMKPSK